jgi:hypothetical protein
MITREHRAAIVRTLAVLGAAVVEAVSDEPAPGEQLTTDEFRAADPAGPDPVPPRDPAEPEPEPGREPEREPEPDPPPRVEPDPPPRAETPPASPRADNGIDAELIRSLGATLVPVFGDAWRVLDEQRRKNQRGSLLLSAELERIQIDAMSRRLAFAEERVWLELAMIEIQLLALLRLRMGIQADWITDARASTPERDELARLELERELAEVALEQAQTQLDQAIGKASGKSGKTATTDRSLVTQAKQRVRDAQAALDAANDAYHDHLGQHGAALCIRQGSVAQSYERDPACVAPIEHLVGLHAELVGVALPRLESLDHTAARKRDEAALVRDQAGLEIRVTYVAATVAALERYTAGGLEARDVAAIVGAVVGIGLGAAITAGVYIP